MKRSRGTKINAGLQVGRQRKRGNMLKINRIPDVRSRYGSEKKKRTVVFKGREFFALIHKGEKLRIREIVSTLRGKKTTRTVLNEKTVAAVKVLLRKKRLLR